MTNKVLNIHYQEYCSIEELTAEDRTLAQAAIEAMANAYAPYSHFQVGAAVQLSNGQIVKGANQENAAFPSGLCAERTALFAASATYPQDDILSIAVAGGPEGVLGEELASPCGACRQVMAQYQAKSGKPLSIIMISSSRILKFAKVDDILPLVFKCL